MPPPSSPILTTTPCSRFRAQTILGGKRRMVKMAAMGPITCIEDLRTLAQRRIPRAIFDYVDGGSYNEVTLASNRRAFDAVQLKQRVMTDVSERSLDCELLGQRIAMPIALAPTGLTGLVCGSGEILACRAADRAGVPFCLSTMSICSIEDVRGATGLPFWFQLYVFRDRGFSKSLVERAREAQCPVLVVTADLPVQGQRHREIKSGLMVPPRLTLRNVLDVLRRPHWLAKVLLGPHKSFGNLAGRIGGTDTLETLASWIASQFDPSLNWKDLDWLRAIWPGKIVVKGILSVEDARAAIDNGVDAIIVSNHGGRQLDGAPPSLEVLPRVVDAVGERIQVLFDSGIRSGQDLLKALALGARACMIGRAFLYGLGALGEEGVTLALDILRRELDVTMALVGCRNIAALSRDVIWH